MFEVETTGTNLNYGKAGQKRLLNDHNTIIAIKNGWIKPNFKYVGQVKTAAKTTGTEVPMPFKQINVEWTLDELTKRLDKLTKEISGTKKVIKELKEIVKKK